MQKFLIILLVTSLPMLAQAADCANGKGEVITGHNGTEYCKSKVAMNWWSANAWCQAIGKQLFDIQTECDKVNGDGMCPNLYQKISDRRYGWTRNIPDDSNAYALKSDNTIITQTRSSGAIGSYSYHALCQ